METLYNISHIAFIVAVAFFSLGLLPADIYRRIKANDLKEARHLEKMILYNIILSLGLSLLIILMSVYHGTK